MSVRARHGQSKCAGAAIAASVLLAAPAAAVDGEILVNQAKVNAGGITPGDTAGFPATLSRPGHYKLSGNLTVPASTRGIEVTANDVTIDLNGFTIRSSSPGAYGIYAESIERLTVVNGTITGFAYGIYASGGAATAVENMRLVSNETMGANAGQYARILNSTIANNGSDGVACGACLVEGNIITGNGFYGVLVSFGASWSALAAER
jgi:hypothetical protein